MAGEHQHAHYLVEVLAAKGSAVEEHVADCHDHVQFRVTRHLRLLERVNKVLHEQGNLVAEVWSIIGRKITHTRQPSLEGEGLVVLGQCVLDVLPEVIDEAWFSAEVEGDGTNNVQSVRVHSLDVGEVLDHQVVNG